MHKELIVGVLFLTALVVLGVFTVLVSDFGVFAETYDLRVIFEDINGLKSGDEVQLAGAAFGKVRHITIRDDGLIAVDLRVERAVPIHEDYTFRIHSASPLGGRIVSFDPGDPKKPEVAPDTQLTGAPRAADLGDAIDRISDLVTAVKQGEGTLAKLINDPTAYQNVLDATESFRAFGEKLDKGEGLVGKLMSADSEKMYDNAAEALDTLRQVAADLREGKGTLGKLLTDESAYEDATALMAKASDAMGRIEELSEELKKGEGLAGRLIYDKEMADNLADTVETIKTVTADVADGKGTLGKFLTDDQFFEKANTMMDSLLTASENISQAEGTLGRLINDPSLYDDAKDLMAEAKKLMAQLRKGVEDAREQAPISSFGSLLLGGFQ